MRLIVAAVSAALALTTMATAQVGTLAQPSCIAGTLPAARAQLRLIPPEMKGAPLAQVRGVIVRSLAWEQGETIRVCFRGGTRKAQERVIRIAREWMQYVNVSFDFEEGGAPRSCEAGKPADVKVAFEANKGWWSMPGTSNRGLDPSMNLQFYGTDTPVLANGQRVVEASMRATILHEFGHALGLMHEHQSPNANCDAEIDWTAAYKVGEEIGWSQEQVDRNFRQMASSTSLNATKVDRKSIMHYSLPPIIFKHGKQSVCFVPENLELSEQDRKFIASIYPKDQSPMVVSAIPPATATRGAVQRPVGAKDRQALVKRYEELLRQSGVESGRAQALTAELRKLVTGN